MTLGAGAGAEPDPSTPGDELDDRVLPGAGLSVAERIRLDASVAPLKPRVRRIVDAAREILDEQGVDALSMRTIAARLDVRAPSLYKHLPDKQAILDVLVADILRENGEVMRAAISGAADPVEALVVGFRAWAVGHPQRYALAMAGPLADDPLVQSAALYSGDPLRWVMRDDLEGAIALWAFSHGMAELEIKSRLPPAYDAGQVWARGIACLRHGSDAVEPPEPHALAASSAVFRGDPPEPVVLSPRAAAIVAAARELLEEEGEEGMSMRRVAARLGVRAPSLYKHLPDKRAMENAIIATVLDDQARLGTVAGEAAAAAGEDTLLAMMSSYRRWALEHPALQRLNMRGPLDQGPLVRGAELRSAEPLARSCGYDSAAALSIWALTHGLIDLEQKRRLPPGYDPGRIFRRGVDALRPTHLPKDTW